MLLWRQRGRNWNTIPAFASLFPEAVFLQTTEADLGPSARFGTLEWWAAGRVERGEELQLGEIESRTRFRVGNRPAYRDGLVLRPGSADLPGPGCWKDTVIGRGLTAQSAPMPLREALPA